MGYLVQYFCYYQGYWKFRKINYGYKGYLPVNFNGYGIFGTPYTSLHFAPVSPNFQICFPAPYLSLHAKYSHRMPNMPRGRTSPGLPCSVSSGFTGASLACFWGCFAWSQTPWYMRSLARTCLVLKMAPVTLFVWFLLPPLPACSVSDCGCITGG